MGVYGSYTFDFYKSYRQDESLENPTDWSKYHIYCIRENP